MKQQNKFLWSIHYFRAFAILNIVLVHLWRIPLETNYGIGNQEIVREVLFNNSTIYFVFISGFIFYYLKENFITKIYYKKKTINVIAPYIFNAITVWIIFYGLNYFEIYTYKPVKINLFESVLTGSIVPHLWYIPFISLIYLISPFLLKIPEKWLLTYSPFLFFIPLLGTRTGTILTIGQYLYFFPIFTLGMFAGINYEKTITLCRSNKVILICICLLTSAILFISYKMYPNGEMTQVQNSIFYIQKLAVIGVILPLFHSIKTNKSELFNKIASMSFAIYFMHYTLGRLQQPILFNFLKEYISKEFWGLFSLIFPFLIIVQCVIISKLLKRVFKKNSRFLIGY